MRRPLLAAVLDGASGPAAHLKRELFAAIFNRPVASNQLGVRGGTSALIAAPIPLRPRLERRLKQIDQLDRFCLVAARITGFRANA